jgi:tRNA(Ile)-lysidine synthase
MQTGVTSAEFALALKKLGVVETHQKIAVAVSGGGDSLALALLIQDWVKAHDGEMLALTVDHKLRDGSTAEAQELQKILRARGIAHEILTWQHNKPATHVQELAREARYRLLLAACRERGFQFLAVAHNIEDQAETFWMRLAHGSGLDGLAAMAAVRESDGITLIRPLLGFLRAQLRATCKEFNTEWIEDPSNSNERYLRVKLRPFEGVLAEEGLTPARLAATAQKLEDARQALEEMARQTATASVQLHPAGYASLKTAAWQAAPRDIQRRVLVQVLQAVAPQEYAPGFEALEMLRLDLHNAAFAGKTLAGCEIFLHKGDILVVREAAAVAARMKVKNGGIWDERFALSDFPEDESWEIGVLGEGGLSSLRKNAPEIKALEDLPFKIKRVLPALWQRENLLAVPHVSYYSADCPMPLKNGRIMFCGKIF